MAVSSAGTARAGQECLASAIFFRPKCRMLKQSPLFLYHCFCFVFDLSSSVLQLFGFACIFENRMNWFKNQRFIFVYFFGMKSVELKLHSHPFNQFFSILDCWKIFDVDLRSLFTMTEEHKHWFRHPGSIKPTFTESKSNPINKETTCVEVGD